jgi:hypothetical protein
LIVVVVAGLASACVSSSEPLVANAYGLIAVDGKGLPADQGAIPQRGLDTLITSNCRLVIPNGELRLDESGRTFHLAYSTASSCTGNVMSVITLDGVYSTSGPHFAFRVPAAVPPDFTFDGETTGHRISVDFGDMTMLFETKGSG